MQCPVCKKAIKVGMGGLSNLWKQHNSEKSKACQLALKKKNKLEAVQRSQPSLQSFFIKRPNDLILPTVPIPNHVIAHVIKLTSSVADISSTLSSIPGTLVNKLLADLEKVISDLPSTHLDSIKIEGSSIFPQPLPTTMDCDDSWEFIVEPHLNHFLGFGKSVESIAALLKGKKAVLVSLTKFLREFTGRFQINGALLEEKVRRLIMAIEMSCVAFLDALDCHTHHVQISL